MKKLNQKKSAETLYKEIDNFDKKYVLDFFNEYSKLSYSENQNQDIKYRQELVKKIKESYYTFQPIAKNKKFAFIKTIVYKQLFKYLHRQIHFNDYIKSIIEVFNTELIKEDKRIDAINAQQSNLLNSINAQQSNIDNVSKNFTELNSRINAIYEIQKRSILNKKKIKVSPGLRIFYSQFGEDQWIVDNLRLPKNGFFIDVGAADGITFSNTYYFEKQGWQGLCFEPNPENYLLAKKFRKNVEPVAIAQTSGMAPFKINPISPDWSGLADCKHLKNNKDTIIIVKTNSLQKIIDSNKISHIDLLSIDAEGSELEVLKSFDILKIKPKIIIIEFLTKDDKSQKNSLINFFRELPYYLVHETKANFIFTLQK